MMTLASPFGGTMAGRRPPQMAPDWRTRPCRYDRTCKQNAALRRAKKAAQFPRTAPLQHLISVKAPTRLSPVHKGAALGVVGLPFIFATLMLPGLILVGLVRRRVSGGAAFSPWRSGVLCVGLFHKAQQLAAANYACFLDPDLDRNVGSNPMTAVAL